MTREYALEQAKKILRTIFEGCQGLKNTPFINLPLLSTAAVYNALLATQKNLVPEIFEYCIFGSTARDAAPEPNDIDLILFDNDFFSPFFSVDCAKEDWYLTLTGNLQQLLEGFLGLSSQPFGDIPVDIHILPLNFFFDTILRKEVASHHKDPDFLEHCFSAMLRYEPTTGELMPIGVEYFETKYGHPLPDLKGISALYVK